MISYMRLATGTAVVGQLLDDSPGAIKLHRPMTVTVRNSKDAGYFECIPYDYGAEDITFNRRFVVTGPNEANEQLAKLYVKLISFQPTEIEDDEITLFDVEDDSSGELLKLFKRSLN